jgi:hypothetical protein
LGPFGGLDHVNEGILDRIWDFAAIGVPTVMVSAQAAAAMQRDETNRLSFKRAKRMTVFLLGFVVQSWIDVLEHASDYSPLFWLTEG